MYGRVTNPCSRVTGRARKALTYAHLEIEKFQIVLALKVCVVKIYHSVCSKYLSPFVDLCVGVVRTVRAALYLNFSENVYT